MEKKHHKIIKIRHVWLFPLQFTSEEKHNLSYLNYIIYNIVHKAKKHFFKNNQSLYPYIVKYYNSKVKNVVHV